MADVGLVALTIVLFCLLALAVKGGRAVVTVVNLIGLVLVITLGILLLAALLFPERF